MNDMDIISKVTKEMFSQPMAEDIDQPIDYVNNDIYTMKSKASDRESGKPSTNGSSSAMNSYVDKLVNNAKPEFNSAKDSGRSSDYNEQVVLPIIEAVVSEYSPEELLNSKKAVELIDSIVLTKNGRGDGYTKSYVKQMYKNAPARAVESDDSEVSRGVAQINSLLDDNQMRSGKQLAERLKKRIDNGELIATEDSYNLINRVALN